MNLAVLPTSDRLAADGTPSPSILARTQVLGDLAAAEPLWRRLEQAGAAALVGIAFLLPFLWFLWRGFVDRRLGVALTGIFALGAVQGAVGWWMVASGLTERVAVSQYRLAFHLTLACLIYAALVRTADRVAT